MEMIKKLFPFSFEQAAALKTKLPVKFTCKEETENMLVCVLSYLLAGIVIGLVFGLIGKILGIVPILGWVVGIVGGVIDLYCLAGIIIHLLMYFGVIK